MTKYFGPGVSGYLDPSGRNWETLPFVSGKPVLDKELNLAQDLDEGAGQSALRRGMPSGWIADDFLSMADPTNGFFNFLNTSLTLQLQNNLVAHVNGWLLSIQHTGLMGFNQLVLPAGPSGNGVRRTDIVVLEVWRRLIVATPSAVGKSTLGRIWQYGNVKTDPSQDATLNFADDIEDPVLAAESTRRVQIQYRLRVIPGIDIFAYPYGMEDPTVFANSVPASAGAPNGVASAYNYTNQSTNGDPGLWRAGDGNPANSLGTVDGYMYSIPLCAVFRRNTTAFDRRLNQNGGVPLSAVTSDRPDGYFNDIFVQRDIADLRMGVSPNGWNMSEVLNKNVNLLFDNNLRTEWLDTSPFGGGYRGATVFAADEIGLSNAHGGDGITTGTTGVGQFLGEFDAVRRVFSARPIYEVITVKVAPPGGGWVNGSSVIIDPTNITIYPYSAFNWASYAPAIVVPHDIESAMWIGPANPKKTANAMPYITSVTNLGSTTPVTMTLTFGTIAALGLTNEPLFVDLLVCYPPGLGLSKTPTAIYGSNSFHVNNFGALPATAPVSYAAVANQVIDMPHREVQLEYTTVNLTIAQAADTTITPSNFFIMPERAATIVTVLRNAAPLVGTVSLALTGRTVFFNNPADYTSPGDNLSITYTAIRPMPQNGEQMTIYYEARAPQAARASLLGSSIQVIPKYIPPSLYVLTAGAGSQDECYPWPQGYVQTGGIYPNSTNTYTGESELSARADVATTTFEGTTGFLQLPIYVPMVANPEGLTFTGVATDVENRSYFNQMSGGGYIPNAYSQSLSDPKRHKNVLPMICELAADSSLGHRGQLVLVLLIRYALFDEVNGVFFDSNLTQNTTVASVFRLKGNLLDKRAT